MHEHEHGHEHHHHGHEHDHHGHEHDHHGHEHDHHGHEHHHHGHEHDHHGHEHDHHAHEHHHHHHDHEHGGEAAAGEIRVERLLHDDAIVVSGDMTITAAEYEPARAELDRQLSAVADAVTDAGGIIGHIKASASVTSVEMFSVTGEDGVAAKKSPELMIAIHLAAIVFAVDQEFAEQAVRAALERVKEIL
ncbi:MAG: hypothetical protein LBD92_06635 [Oscillospiraceae bacterium]|jgi:hypothetical protein|nr:hypothetical protein [Oscillospiraceae bacterium]